MEGKEKLLVQGRAEAMIVVQLAFDAMLARMDKDRQDTMTPGTLGDSIARKMMDYIQSGFAEVRTRCFSHLGIEVEITRISDGVEAVTRVLGPGPQAGKIVFVERIDKC